MKAKSLLTSLFVILAGAAVAQTSATIDSVWFSEETACDGENLVRICYTISESPECSCRVDVYATADGGSSWVAAGDGWFVSLSDTEGNLGVVDSGTHCFLWNMGTDLPDSEGHFFGFKVATNCVCRQNWLETDFSDFADGDTTANVKILTPDPDGTDSGALWIPPGRDTIYVLQVYPDGHCTYCMSSAIYSYMSSGTPPLNIKIYLITISNFNATATSPASTLSVQYIDPSNTIHPAENLPFSFFDVVMFGVADSYGDRDLAPAAADAVRAFCRMGKGLLLTHDTAGCSPGHCMPTFCSLTDISGISCTNVSSWALFNQVEKVTTEDLPLLHTPFELPDTFPVTTCHWKGQVVEDGWFLYRGIASSGDPRLYWQAYHNPEYNSFSSFFSYGHTETVPAEWEAKAMINSIYYAYRGGIGNGVYTSSVHIIPGGALLDTFEISVDVPDCGSFYRLEVAVDTCIDDTITPACWTSWFDITDSMPSLPPFDAIKYRVGLSLGIDCGSPIVHWVKFVFKDSSSSADSVLGVLDSRPPRVYAECWSDSILYVGASLGIRWHSEDLYPADPSTVSVEIRGIDCDFDTTLSTADTELTFSIPEELRGCSGVEFFLSVPDSFCNIGHDSCTLELNLCEPAVAWAVCPPAGSRIITSCETQQITFAVVDTSGRTVDTSRVFLSIIRGDDTLHIPPDSIIFETEGDTIFISIARTFSDNDSAEIILDSIFATDGCKIFP